jgi:hypothetical protein
MTTTTRLMLPLLLLFAPHALGVAKVTTPVSKLFDDSACVIVGKVTKVTPDTGVVEATITTLKGEGVGGDSIKVKLELPDVLKNTKEGAPIVLLLGHRAASNTMHLADTWLFPQSGGGKASFRVTSDLEKNLKQSFPGSTAAVRKLLEEIKQRGKSTVLDAAGDVFKGGTKPFGKVDTAGATALFTLKRSGQAPVVLAATADTFKRFDLTPEGLKPGRRSIDVKPNDLIALSVFGPSLLTLKKNGEVSSPQTSQTTTAPTLKPAKLWSDGSQATAAAFGNFGEDPDKVYALVVKDNNIYRYALDGSSPPTDFYRLTGERITNYHKDEPNWLAGATVRPLDANGDNRTDLLINTRAGSMLLINRGYGAFFIDADLPKVLVDSANNPLLSDKTLWTPADVDNDGLDDLLLLAPDGSVTAVLNPKPEKKP